MLTTHLEIVESIGRLSVAPALGSAMGFERQWHQKMVGLRTNALVALGSCGFVVFSAMVGEGDPTRVAAQVVTGIGFLVATGFVVGQAGLSLRRIDSSDIPNTPNVAVTAQVVAAKRNDAAVEQIVGRLSLEPHIGAVAWQVDRTIAEAGAACLDRSDCALDPMTLAAEGPSRRSEPFRA